MTSIYQYVTGLIRTLGVLPQNVSNRYIKALREREIEENLYLYEWVRTPTPEDIGWGLPRYVNASKYQELPPLFKRTAIREKDVDGNRFSAAVKAALSFVEGMAAYCCIWLQQVCGICHYLAKRLLTKL